MTRQRAAVATLELVLALPIILTLLVALVWLGYSVIGQAEVNVQARHTAWSQRFDPWADRLFDFTADDIATGSSSASVEVTPLLDSELGPESRHQVEKGPWDHRSIDFGPVPNWRLYVQTSVGATLAGLPHGYQDVQQIFAELQQLSAGNLQQALAAALLGLDNPGAAVGQEGSPRQNQLELEQNLERSKIESTIRDLRQEIADVQRALRNLRDDAEEGQEERIWIREQILKRLRLLVDYEEARLADL